MLSDDSILIDLDERLGALLEQEKDYKSLDYMSPDHLFRQTDDVSNNPLSELFPSGVSSCSSTASSSCAGVNEIWREKICEWSYQVIDHFDFNREIVTISLNYLDRFLNSRPVNKKVFQLAAMTTLYLAIKLFEPGTLKMSSLIELSRGYFSVHHIAAMEETILRSLFWKVHPVTPLCFIRHLLFLLPRGSCTQNVKHDIMELSRFLTELSVCDYYFVTHKPSSIGLAALLNAIDGVDETSFSRSLKLQFKNSLESATGLDCSSPEVEECRIRLREMYFQGGYYEQPWAIISEPNTPENDDTRIVSPVCVSGVDTQHGVGAQHQSDAYHDNYVRSKEQHFMVNSGYEYSSFDRELEDMSISNVQQVSTRDGVDYTEKCPPSRKSCKTVTRKYPGDIKTNP
mmetsp:Transcript_13440/g.19234  ORF Transcript_13440/g.19234 Transcript_13440/m.19234 type:complete len:400 (+) Transcript_13440:80-1279(+)|eukprot:CAMPEP_0184855220 /NCGR_PEP_ID=MMETSP0580-20130426/528_1 /TAXON_ID=1118495 /ORGANISM="Dactyliosolen fragilissimus" /LENGTH=399 /DNA_ID=CAMNT_0027349677 /DNA_START=48 /DNA_END=1247 /DNA_ORIENTATION=+